ncbi:MAG: tetratricopeptide repeat protein, partial [Planctomycetia bacterium]|nr:tetratricopeptide repeat protein [Planctomycetia bacterium]
MSNADFGQRLPSPAASVIATAWQLAQQQQPEQGLKLLADLLNRDQTNIDAWLVAGNILQHYGEFAQAADTYRRVLGLVPDHSAARQSLAMTQITMGKLVEAEALIDQIVASQPQSADAWAMLAVLRQKQNRQREAADAFRRSLTLKPNPIHHSNLLQILQYMDDVTPEALLAAHREWDATYALNSTLPSPPNLKPETWNLKRAPLRLGFLSADFGRHPTGWLALRPIECLDKSQCSIVCYYDRLPEDDFTARFRSASDAWHVTATWSDDQLFQQIGADKIDILFDLMCHTGPRLRMFARRPAPVQITWLGY